MSTTPEPVIWLELTKAGVAAAGAILAAIVVAVVGQRIARNYSAERDRQDKESQWRQHAIELTKLDLERKIKTLPNEEVSRLRPSILDFLANYRDLTELDRLSPKDLYTKIIDSRIKQRPPAKKK